MVNVLFTYFLTYLLAGKPVITFDDKYKSAQKLKAGSTLTISVNVSGTPTPKVSWLQAGEPVAAASVDTKDNQSTLTVKNVTAKLAGQVQVKAENKVGSDSAEFTVEIKGLTNAVSLQWGQSYRDSWRLGSVNGASAPPPRNRSPSNVKKKIQSE